MIKNPIFCQRWKCEYNN